MMRMIARAQEKLEIYLPFTLGAIVIWAIVATPVYLVWAFLPWTTPEDAE